MESGIDEVVAQLQKENQELRELVKQLQERNQVFAQMLFGPQSEKAGRVVGSANDDAPDPPGGGSGASSGASSNSSAGKKRGGRNRLPDHLPRVRQELAYQKVCACGAGLRVIGEHTVEKLAVLPAMFYVIVNVHKHTACPDCEAINCARAEPSLVPNTQATPELLAHLAIGKTADGLPIYRQEKQAARSACPISRDKLNRWFIQLGLALTPLLKLIADVFNNSCIGGIDETRLQVINEPEKTAQQLSYLFIRYGGPPNNRVMLVDYEQNKNQQTVDKLLDPFEGKALVSDMYSAFIAFVEKNAAITLYACHDHARRKFVEALKLIPKDKRKDSFAGEVVELYKGLYKVEALAKGRSPRVIKKLRRRARKILNRLYKKIEAVSVTPTSKLGNAIRYAISHKKALYAYLDNPLAPISNIKTEHIAKLIAVARKNFLFCYSVQGAQALANVMTLVYTAQLYPEHNLQEYLTIVFAELPKAQTDEDLEALLPWVLTPMEVSRRINLRPRPDISETTQAA